jgi:superfamily II DNA helicase RecQ
VSYGKKAQEQINSNSFYPSFAHYITDFDETTKCLACHSFPKCTARGLCRLCRFYVDNGLKDQIVDKNYQSKVEVSEKINLETLCRSALNGVFCFSDFRDGQKDAILSFVQNYDTLVLKQTGGGKSLCYALASIMTTGITVVFSPLKALIDDQVLELINAGIPCCGLYASTAQSVHYQQKVFQEISCGLTKVIFTTPEKFKFNVGFRKMLERVGTTKDIRFVVDEVHCILDQEHFR